MKSTCYRIAAFLPFLLSTVGNAEPINLEENFFADPEVFFSDGGFTATLTEGGVFTVILSNDPGLGDPEVIIPGPDTTLLFDYNFVEGGPLNDDEFGVFLLDPSTGGSLGAPTEFFTQDSSAGTIAFDLSPFSALSSVGLQFQLSALFGDGAFDSIVEITNVRLEVTAVPEPATLGLFAVGLGIVGVSGYRRRRQRGK